MPAPIDLTCELMKAKLVYRANERDLVLLRHSVTVREASGKRAEHVVTMIEYGRPGGASAMAITVGVPTAVAADLILEGVSRGVVMACE